MSASWQANGSSHINKPDYPFVLNAASPQANGLVGWWPFYAGGKMLDRSGQGNHGSQRGNPSFAAGIDGSSALYSTGGNCVSLPFPVIGSSAQFTLAFWHFPLSWTGGFTTLFDDGTNSGNRCFTQFFDTSGVDATFAGICITTSGGSGLTMASRKWWHYCVTRTGGNNTFYLNGFKIKSGANSGASSGNPLYLGFNSSTGGSNYNGYYEGVMRYNRALQPAEVWSLYDPATRWQLRYRLGKTKWFLPSAAAPAGVLFRRTLYNRTGSRGAN